MLLLQQIPQKGHLLHQSLQGAHQLYQVLQEQGPFSKIKLFLFEQKHLQTAEVVENLNIFLRVPGGHLWLGVQRQAIVNYLKLP